MEGFTDTEQKIINAATVVFLEKGLDGARMQEIADQAGINKALLHYYFRSKDRLFQTVFQNEIKNLLRTILESAQATQNFEQFLQSFLTTYMKAIAPRTNLMRFAIWEFGKDNYSIVDTFLQTFREYGYPTNPLVATTQKAINEGQIRPLNPAHFTLSLLGMCIFPFMIEAFIEKIIPGVNMRDEQFIEQRAKEIYAMIWNGIKPAEKKTSKKGRIP